MTITTYKWSVKEWHELIDSGVVAGKSVQLWEGEIVTMSPEKPIHSSRIVRVADYLRNVLRGQAQIREAHPVTLDNSEPEPDIAIVRWRDDYYDERHPIAEDIYWLVEVANQTWKTDLKAKSIVYARNQIPEYWVIDLINQQLIIHSEPENDRYRKVVKYTDGAISALQFPTAEINIDVLVRAKN